MQEGEAEEEAQAKLRSRAGGAGNEQRAAGSGLLMATAKCQLNAERL